MWASQCSFGEEPVSQQNQGSPNTGGLVSKTSFSLGTTAEATPFVEDLRN